MNQTATGEELKQQGIDRAILHQERVEPGWKETAYKYLSTYARVCNEFTAEDVINASAGVVPEAPERRAWGGIFLRAAKANIITRIGYRPMQNPQAHKKPTTLWQSTLSL